MDKPVDADQKLFPLSHLVSIAVSGADSAKFLQGQLTCDINSVSESQASIAAFCNPKGRVISTLLVVKTVDNFLLILPVSLVEKVLNKLKMYVLRSAVQLSDQSQNLKLFGLNCLSPQTGDLSLPTRDFGVLDNDVLFVKLPSPSLRYLCVSRQPLLPPPMNEFTSGAAKEWRYQDISSGLPWFNANQSELYIPQMLNIDGLGGISFNKGCYTGQEIIARTHYLGKAKRNLFLAECDGTMEAPESGTAILDGETRHSVGTVLDAETFAENTRLLVVLQTIDAESKHLILDDAKQTAIKIDTIQ